MEPAEQTESINELAIKALKNPAGRNAFLNLLDGSGEMKKQSIEELGSYFSVILISY